MTTRIVYDTEFVDDGMTIAPLSIAMRRSDGAQLYAIFDSLENFARAAERAWMRDNVLKWLPVEVTLTSSYGRLDANVTWNEDHPDFRYVRALDEIASMVTDFVLEKPDPQLWGYYVSYDHVLYAQLFGPMVDLPDGMPMYSMDLKHEAEMCRNPQLPLLPSEIVTEQYGGIRREHDARYDAHEEEWRLEWLLGKKTRG